MADTTFLERSLCTFLDGDDDFIIENVHISGRGTFHVGVEKFRSWHTFKITDNKRYNYVISSSYMSWLRRISVKLKR